MLTTLESNIENGGQPGSDETRVLWMHQKDAQIQVMQKPHEEVQGGSHGMLGAQCFSPTPFPGQNPHDYDTQPSHWDSRSDKENPALSY